MQSRWVAVAAFAVCVASSASARADGLSAAETARLMGGGTVARPQVIERGDRRYVGGVAYAIVEAQTAELTALLDDVHGWRRFLPKTRDARKVGKVDGDALIEVTHGSALVQVTYTMRMRRSGNLVRFWMDPSRTHDIEDMWGFFRAEPFEGGRTLVTYGILIDIGSGLLRDLFENRVRELALTVPQRVRGLMLQRRIARNEESLLVTGAAERY